MFIDFSMRKLKNSELERLSVQEFKLSAKTPLIIVLDNIRSLNNIGSVFRTCDAFLIEKIYLCGITAKPPHKDIHKTALGSTDSVTWEYIEDTLELVERLKAKNIKIVSVEQTENATMLNDFTPQQQTTYAIVFGNEVKGVSQYFFNACYIVVFIPHFVTKHSLYISFFAVLFICYLFIMLILLF